MVENSLLPQKLPSPYDDPDGADDVGCFVAVRDVDCVSSDLEGRDSGGDAASDDRPVTADWYEMCSDFVPIWSSFEVGGGTKKGLRCSDSEMVEDCTGA